ncbi:glycosyltransferase [Roseitalea sp. MMSF_3504]|uniref:glycosyltransferase n=1 Tax=Roseitalea sp. MMSF_3504 TaxID=3046716 RepID=UPI00273D8FEA|nr:glycosyltransferase [Roseitalea sp. MMSF_3504]
MRGAGPASSFPAGDPDAFDRPATSGPVYNRASGQGKRAFIGSAPIGGTRRKARGDALPDLCPSCAFLAGYGFAVRLLARATRMAAENGTSAGAELMAHGAITEDAYYSALADHLGVPFLEPGDIAAIMAERSGPPDLNAPLVWCRLTNGDARAVAAPDPRAVPAIEAMVAKGRDMQRIAIATPRALRALTERQFRPALLDQAIHSLAFRKPAMSARSGARFWQGFAVAAGAAATGLAFWLAPGPAALVLHLAMSAFFFGCVALRVAAATGFEPQEQRPLAMLHARGRPRYSVLVCLYREADVVHDLIVSLKRLNWPRSKLQVLLICEADDEPTLAALEAADLPPVFTIVRVPKATPRTKPKALNYALAFARGDLITVYDAEDRPHPDQLEEAWQTFDASETRVACLQAPLVKANAGRNALTALFHLEYAGLFHGMLPWLARNGCPIMLGGTSNHFRRRALDQVGGWDPFNVTEDADLGLRLWRHGYRTGVLTRPTLEDAPHTMSTWLPQRTRWLKGWMQTLVVHTREPMQLYRNMGVKAFVVTQVLLLGTLVSALLHPLILVNAIAIGVWMLVQSPHDVYLGAMAWLDWGMILTSYLAFGTLCWRATNPPERAIVGWRVALVPLYWLIQSLAAWRAVGHLLLKPFHWEKTPHGAHQGRY